MSAIIAVPSIDLGPRYEARTDLASFETRWLYLLLALRDPGARVAVVTSDRVPDWEVDYYLSLIPDAERPRERLLMVALDDLDNRPLAGKLAARPELLAQLRDFAAGDGWIVPFNVTTDDERVAEAIGVPLFGIASRFARHGTKSGGRELLERAGVPIPAGFANLRTAAEVDSAASAVGRPVVVKLDHG